MWFCITGMLLCSSPLSTAAFQIPGPLSYAPQVSTYNYAWNYAAYCRACSAPPTSPSCSSAALRGRGLKSPAWRQPEGKLALDGGLGRDRAVRSNTGLLGAPQNFPANA